MLYQLNLVTTLLPKQMDFLNHVVKRDYFCFVVLLLEGPHTNHKTLFYSFLSDP